MPGYETHKTTRLISHRRAVALAEVMVFGVLFLLLAYALCAFLA